MEKGTQNNQQFLDARSIPKFQFELLDEELINCIKELYLQSKGHQKIISQHKKQLSEKVSTENLIDSLKLLESGGTLPAELQNLIPSGSKDKVLKDVSNPILTTTARVSQHLAQLIEVVSALNNKISTIDKRVVQSEQRTSLSFKQKVASLENQLLSFVNDYRSGFKDLSANFQNIKLDFELKSQQIETNTLWKINECSKRLEDRPNLDMVKSCVLELETKITRMLQSGKMSPKTQSIGNSAKLEQNMIKLKKQMELLAVETQAQIKSIHEKLSTNFMSLKSFADQKLEITKKLENFHVALAQTARKSKSQQTKANEALENSRTLGKVVAENGETLSNLNQRVQRLIKSDEFARLLQKIDPHELCRLSTSTKSLEEKSLITDRRIDSLTAFAEALRSKMEFWNVANGQNPEKQDQKLNLQLITKIIKEQIGNSEFKTKMLKFQQQLLSLSSLKQGINDILKKIARNSKDNDLTNFKYELQGLQEYLKKEILILTNRLNLCESSLSNQNDTKKRPISARGKEEGKMFASLSTKKLLPVNCISCHQTNALMVERERKTIFNSKLVQK